MELKETLRKLADMALECKIGAISSDGCMYDDGQGHMCAIGALLTPKQKQEVYDAEMNQGADVSTLIHAGIFDPEKYGMCRYGANFLQQMHDGYFGRLHDSDKPINDFERVTFGMFLHSTVESGLIRVWHEGSLTDLPIEDVFGKSANFSALAIPD